MKKALHAITIAAITACGSRAGTPADARARCFVAPRASHVTAIHGARVFDGERVWDDRDVVLADGLIAYVGPPTCVEDRGSVLEDLDLTGLTLMPGLVDAHVHAGDAAETLEQALVFGVTTVIDMFGPPERLRRARADALAGAPATSADVFGAGTLATAPNGHGTEYGIDIPTIERAADAQAFVDARLAEGSDFLKIVLEREAKATLAPDVASALAAAAHARGRLVFAHVGTQKDAADAVAAHVDGLEHVWLDEPLDSATAAAIAAQHVSLTPTLSMLEMHCGLATGKPLLDDARIAPLLSDAQKKRLVRTYRWATPADGPDACVARGQAIVRALSRRAGAPILAGTDSPNGATAFGASLHRELELLVAAGLRPIDALVAATSAPADAFRLRDRGRLAPGLRADVVAVEGDPTKDILATRAIRTIWQRGERVDRWAIASKR